MAKKEDKKHYAFVEHETVQAMLHSLFRFQTPMQAQLVSNRFADQFILSPRMSDPRDRKAMFLWVRDLDLTDEQRGLGYCGNYGKITLHKLPNGRWTLSMVKVDVPLNKHPVYNKTQRRYPNTGHPVIRASARNKTWPTMQAAFEVLMQMHEEFPEISVPGVNKLRIMMYQKTVKGQSPIQRLELSVVKREEGVYGIEMKVLNKDGIRRMHVEPPAGGPTTSTPNKKSDKPTEGRYTAMVAKQRKKKKKK